MLKRIMLIAAAIVLLCAIPAMAGKPLPDVVATVNGEKISLDELTRTAVDWLAPMVLDDLIGYRLVGQEARKAGVVVTEAQVKAKMDEYKKNLPPGQTFEEMLRRSGMTPSHAFAYLKMQMQAEGVIKKSIKVTDKELAEYRRASHVLISVTPMAEPAERDKIDQEAKTKIQKIYEEIKGGLAFEEAAKKYSEDLQNKEAGGDLDFITKGQTMPEFEQAIFALKVGEMSEPVKTSYGYHIIKLTGIGSDLKGEKRQELVDKITQLQVGQKYREWLLSVRNKADIKNYVEPIKPAPKPAVTRPPQPRPTIQPTPPPAPTEGEMVPGIEDTPPPPPEQGAAPGEAAPPAPPAPPATPAPTPAPASAPAN